MVYLTRVEKFNAAHKLYVEDWSEEKNKSVFGKCANKNWHGHNYILSVTVKGNPDPVTGFLFDARKMSEIMHEVILDRVDHLNLNIDVDFIPKGVQPSTENLVILFWKQLENCFEGATLHCIKLSETDKIYAEYYGE